MTALMTQQRIMYTREQAAEALSISTSQLDEFRRAGLICAVKFGGRGIRFLHQELEDFANSLPAA